MPGSAVDKVFNSLPILTMIKVSSKPRNDDQFSTHDGITRSARFALTCKQTKNVGNPKKKFNRYIDRYFINLSIYYSKREVINWFFYPRIQKFEIPRRYSSECLKLFYLRNSGQPRSPSALSLSQQPSNSVCIIPCLTPEPNLVPNLMTRRGNSSSPSPDPRFQFFPESHVRTIG